MLRKIVLVVLVLAAVPPQFAQNPSPPPITLPDITGDRRPPSPEEVRRRKAMEKELTKQRYQEIRNDTDQLVALANQLKQEVDQAGQGTLSLAVVKKADQIEKLAKSVKNKMKGD